jgi:hypothetical protein
MLCRISDATLSLLLVALLSPESRSGPFGPKPFFGLLAFELDQLNSARINPDASNPRYSRPVQDKDTLRKEKHNMNQDTEQVSESIVLTTNDGTQKTIQPDGRNTTLPTNDASRAIVQCLLIAARRGRQIRIAREQAAQLRQSDQ